MAISYRSTAPGSANNVASFTLSLPAGVVAGDLLLMSVATQSATISTPSGWTVAQSMSGTSARVYVFWKFAGASEPASYTVTASVSDRLLGAISAYSGVDSTTPVDASATNSGSGSTSMVAPSVTTTMAGAFITAHYGFYVAASTATATAPGGMTERSDLNVGGANNRNALATYDVVQAASGASGTKTATANGGASYAAATVALRPAVAAPAVSGWMGMLIS